MPPLANNEHQSLSFRMGVAVHSALRPVHENCVFVGVNVSDREVGWEQSYRVPDLAVILPGGKAKDCGTHWCGGPDFLAEIISPGDNTRDKQPFYSELGVREWLIIDRYPWMLELYRLNGGQLECVGTSLPGGEPLVSEVLSLTFRLLPAAGRPTLEIARKDGTQHWLV